jgi:hypothetical protein
VTAPEQKIRHDMSTSARAIAVVTVHSAVASSRSTSQQAPRTLRCRYTMLSAASGSVAASMYRTKYAESGESTMSDRGAGTQNLIRRAAVSR